MSETVIKIKVGDLVQQKSTGDIAADRVREDRVGLTGVVLDIKPTEGPLALWSPVTVGIYWSDGVLTPGYLLSALEKIEG